ncbi:MAG: hypothetical protein ACTSWY_09680 [Promethearchaeota archaeon]
MDREKKEDSIFDWIVKSIDLLVHNSISETVILSSYKLNTVLKNNYGVNIRVDKIGRTLRKYAEQRKLKRLATNIPKYAITKADYKEFQGKNLFEKFQMKSRAK